MDLRDTGIDVRRADDSLLKAEKSIIWVDHVGPSAVVASVIKHRWLLHQI
jgi:hypothetical protein